MNRYVDAWVQSRWSNKYDSIFVTDVMKELLMWKVFMITFERRVLREIERKSQNEWIQAEFAALQLAMERKELFDQELIRRLSCETEISEDL